MNNILYNNLLKLHNMRSSQNQGRLAFYIILCILAVIGLYWLGYDTGKRQIVTSDTVKFLEGYRLSLPEEISQIKDQNDSIPEVLLAVRDTKTKTIVLAFPNSVTNKSGSALNQDPIQEIFITKRGIKVHTKNRVFDELSTRDFSKIFHIDIHYSNLVRSDSIIPDQIRFLH